MPVRAIMRQIVPLRRNALRTCTSLIGMSDRSIVRLSHYRDFADSAAEARLALADNGTIIEAGSNAARLLASDDATLGWC